MPRRVQLSRRARNWLDDHTDYLLTRSPPAAARAEERILNALRQLVAFPHSGARGPSLGTRRLVAGPYVLTYREAGPELLIVIDIRHRRQRDALPPDQLA